MSNSVICTIAVISFLFSGAVAHAHSFKVSKLSWIGDVLHVEVKTDAPDGTKLNIAMSDEKTGDRVITDLVEVTVNSGEFTAEGFGTDNNDRPLRPGHYWLSVAELERPLAFVGVPITVPKRPKDSGIKQKAAPAETEEADANPGDSPEPSVSEIKQSWADDVLRITGKTDLPDGTWLNVAIQDDDGALVADEGFICAQVSGGQFIVEGFTKDGIKPVPPGRYKLSIEPQNPLQSGFGFSAEKTITVTKRPDFTKSRLADVRAINGANYANAKDNAPAATKSEDVSGFQRGLSDALFKHGAISSVLTRLTSSGALRLNCGEGKAWIDPGLWQASNAEDKENLAHAIYENCGDSVDIYDAQSAKKLARYGSVLGFKTY